MSLQFVIGSSGFGKSTYLYDDIIKRSINNPDNNFIVVVPEQYTMETQKKLVMLHPKKGILNIDVVSFERLAYKVFEEVGDENRTVLDDTGKNLIIRKVLENQKKKMRFFGNSINKTGFVSELKSIVSEMLQYDIGLEQLEMIKQEASSNNQLKAKLDDISIVYSSFKEYLSDHYITSEEILDVLCGVIEKSEKIRKSEIIFDGFTGFTPIQYKLIRILLTTCENIQVSVTIDAKEKINVYEGMQNLFFMSKDMIQKLQKICDEEHIEVKNHILLNDQKKSRYASSEELAFLEQNLFRYNRKKYEKEVENIKLFAASTPKEEIQYAISNIIKLTRKENYRYKDIAIVSGDISQYGTLTGNMLQLNDIPYFLDYKRSVTDNPFVEMIRSALEIVEKGYSYDSVFRYLRTGMTDISREEIDVLDNYCLAVGIRGRKLWYEPWKKKSRRKESAYDYTRLEELRVLITTPLQQLDEALRDKEGTVRDYVMALYTFIVNMNSQKKIIELSELEETGNEYNQLYQKVIDLLDKMVELLGEEHVSIKEFAKIMDAGFEEIKVGLIPPTSDCVVVGDIERTRLDNIKVMFFLGMNDGIVPKKNDNRGILSEADRSILENMEVVLAPTSRQKAFIQKFYLYLIMTKASNKLYITFAKKDSGGKSLMPSYLLRNMKMMYSKICVDDWDENAADKSYVKIPKAEIIWSEENYIKTLSQVVVDKMYGDNITGSISAFEKYASCQFAYYLQYGLKLQEREEYKFQISDIGTILHAVIEDVTKKIKDEKMSYSLITDEQRRKMVDNSIKNISEVYGNTILKDTSRNEFMIKRMTDLADRTIWAIGKQLECGLFHPDGYEMNFVLDNEVVGEKKTLSMKGKIDRIDICEDDNNVYVRIVDYKSGKSDFDLLKTYYGLKLQLIMYMKAARHIEKLRHKNEKNIIPAGVMYFNIDNPIIDMTDDVAAFDGLNENEQHEAIEKRIQESLRMKGIVNERVDIIKKMDDTDGKSLNVPIAFKKGGEELDERRSKTISTEQFDKLEEYVTKKAVDMTKEIFNGQLNINPYQQGDMSACNNCEFSAVCGFSPDLRGDAYRYIRKMDKEEIWKKINAEISRNDFQNEQLESKDIEKGVDKNGESMD